MDTALNRLLQNRGFEFPVERAMRWLGDSREAVEEALFQRRRDLFTECTAAFSDTTSLYFEGRGGEGLGQFGYSKDHRPDRRR